MPSSPITARMFSRRAGTPWPEPYCSAVSPRSVITVSKALLIRESGSADTNGMPPASETTSGREATANSARTSEALRPEVRSA
jgi:hypothetical protein